MKRPANASVISSKFLSGFAGIEVFSIVELMLVMAGIKISICNFHVISLGPHNSNPRHANAAALLSHEEAATSAAGAFDADSNGSDAAAELWSRSPSAVGIVNRPVTTTALPTA